MMLSLDYRKILRVSSYPRNAKLAEALHEAFSSPELDSSHPMTIDTRSLMSNVRATLERLSPATLPALEDSLLEASQALEAPPHTNYASTALRFRKLAQLMQVTLHYDRRLVRELKLIKAWLTGITVEKQGAMLCMLSELARALDTYILSGSSETEDELIALFHFYFHEEKRAMLLGSEAEAFYSGLSPFAREKVQELVNKLEVYLLLRQSGTQDS